MWLGWWHYLDGLINLCSIFLSSYFLVNSWRDILLLTEYWSQRSLDIDNVCKNDTSLDIYWIFMLYVVGSMSNFLCFIFLSIIILILIMYIHSCLCLDVYICTHLYVFWGGRRESCVGLWRWLDVLLLLLLFKLSKEFCWYFFVCSLFWSQWIATNGMPLLRYILVMTVLVCGQQSQLCHLSLYFSQLVSTIMGKAY